MGEMGQKGAAWLKFGHKKKDFFSFAYLAVFFIKSFWHHFGPGPSDSTQVSFQGPPQGRLWGGVSQ